MKTILKQLFEKYKIDFTEEMLDKFEKYYDYTIKINQQFNLTAITEKNEFAIKHFLDCALAEKFLPKNATVVDIGAGAGFPSVPLKILREDLTIVMVDSLNKRVNFLNDVISLLGLKNISAVHARAEDFAKQKREYFDVSIARAVANLSTLSEYCLPLTKVGGMFLSLKGQAGQEEVELAQNAITILGGKLERVEYQKIEEIDSDRCFVLIKKIKPTLAKYPRGKNLPRVKPL